jgi:hypothetical protein
MNKEQVVKFSELQIGDYFTDNARQKYRKIPEYDLELPNFPPTVINCFHIQSNAIASVNPDDEFIFIAHSTWDSKEHKDQFIHTVPEAELEHQLDFFTNYFETLKTSLNSIETSDNSFDDEFFSNHEVDEFTNLMRSSFFVSIYSYLEARLNNEYRDSQKDNPQIKISLDDIHGAGINRAKTYLVKVLDTSFPFDDDSDWEKIQWFHKIRNCIVHTEGKVNDKNLSKYIENHPKLHCEMFFGNEYVILDDGLCENAITVIGAFLRSLLFHRQADKIC